MTKGFNIETKLYNLNNLGSINILLGKNGCGKSTLLRSIARFKSDQYNVSYIPPERGGKVQYEVNSATNASINGGDSFLNERINNENQTSIFKEQSFQRFNQLKSRISDNPNRGIKTFLELLNNINKDLFGNVMIHQNIEDYSFRFYPKNCEIISATEVEFNENKEKFQEYPVGTIAQDDSKRFKYKNNYSSNNWIDLTLKDQNNIPKDDNQISTKNVHELFDNYKITHTLSSGENELLCLVIECMWFAEEASTNENKDKYCLLLLDEPDVHLHPDAQIKFIKFLQELADRAKNLKFIIATHSLTILNAGINNADYKFAFMQNQEKSITFNSIIPEYEKILPSFGIHPLSQVFNQKPILIVDGEDDERIWVQAVRSSLGKINVYPCPRSYPYEADFKHNEFDEIVNKICLSLYENSKAYSLRDGDKNIGENIDDLEKVIRMRLNCYSAENLVLTDELLQKQQLTFETLKNKLDYWISSEDHKDKPEQHEKLSIMKEFKNSDYDRRCFKIKDITNLIVGSIMNCTRSWETLVGQTIANIKWNESTDFKNDGSILCFLGEKLVRNVIDIYIADNKTSG